MMTFYDVSRVEPNLAALTEQRLTLQGAYDEVVRLNGEIEPIMARLAELVDPDSGTPMHERREKISEVLDITGDIQTGFPKLDDYNDPEDEEQDLEPSHLAEGEEETSHKADPHDPHWQEDRSHLLEKRDHRPTGPTATNWKEPIFLDKNGRQIHGATDPREQSSPDPTLVSHAMLNPGPRTK